jgi:S1-C subfamily serine protease
MESRSVEIGNALAALSNDLATAVERAGRSVVGVHGRPRTPSSGVYWRPGVVVTADHTVRRDEDISVILPDGRSVPAALAGRDPSTDLAVLKVQTNEAPAVEIGDAGSLKVGHLALALGRGESGSHGPVASLAVISALGEAWHTWQGGRIDRFVRLDVSIFVGFSGGPLVGARGEIVGINTTGLWRGVGMAIPASTVDRVVREILEKGRIARGYLGLGMHPVGLPEALRRKLNLPGESGMIVVTVEPGGPGEKAGVVIGDVLVALGGSPVSDIGDVQKCLGSDQVGKPLRASLIRGGEITELTISVGERSGREG